MQNARSRRVSRRDLLALGVGAFVVSAGAFAFGRRRRLVRRRVPVMGTFADLAVVADDTVAAHAAIDAAVDALIGVDRTMSRFRVDSDVGRANALAGREAVEVTADTAFVLERALAFAAATDGVFDPCLGAAVRLWDVDRRDTPVAETRTRALAGRGLWRTLDLDRSGGRSRAFLREEDAGLDLGGIAKGHGVDRAAAALRDRGIRDGLVNVGGDLVALGRSADGDAWSVGIRDPHDPRGVLEVLEVVDEAVATSGDYEHGFSHRGRRYHHLLDPGTARPGGRGVHSVTVRAPTCLEADAAATALFLLDPAAGPAALRGVAPKASLVLRA